jgi:hypothetical protein
VQTEFVAVNQARALGVAALLMAQTSVRTQLWSALPTTVHHPVDVASQWHVELHRHTECYQYRSHPCANCMGSRRTGASHRTGIFIFEFQSRHKSGQRSKSNFQTVAASLGWPMSLLAPGRRFECRSGTVSSFSPAAIDYWRSTIGCRRRKGHHG